MTNDDPHDQTAAAEEQPNGEQTPARAELLGTTALTARVRCTCGKRQDIDREDWQWNGVAVCSRCGRGILDHSLHVISRGLALAMIEARRPTEGELRALRRMELALRDFISRYDSHPRWYWSPPTNAMADRVGLLLSELDESRSDRGAAPAVRVASSSLDDTPEGEHEEGDDSHDGSGGGPTRKEAGQRLTLRDLLRAKAMEASEGLAAELAAAKAAAEEEEPDDEGTGEEEWDEEEDDGAPSGEGEE